jgi:tetratricopeptide (TPR) repeat protein
MRMAARPSVATPGEQRVWNPSHRGHAGRRRPRGPRQGRMSAPAAAARAVQDALALQRAGRLAEAEAAYERLLARWPALPDSWFNLAVLQRKAGRFEAALASYARALGHGVSKPEEVHLNRGVIYADHLRREDAAEAELAAALALNPNYVPALLNLANLHEDHGNRDAALALYERALALEPASPLALARYAGLKPGADDVLVGRLRQALARPGTAPADRADLGFGLGKVLDAAGAFDAAFAAYTAANRDSRLAAQGRFAPYDRRRQEALIDAVIAMFTPERVAQLAPAAPDPAPPPLFICGMFRSGSTLTEQVLAAHPRVAAGGEIDFLPTLARTTLAPFPAAMARTSPAELARIAAQYRAKLAALFPGAERVTDKRPDNFLYIGLIKCLFPKARIVHTLRAPLDNCLSVFFLHLDPSMAYALDLMDIGHYYAQYRRLMAHWRALFGADILDFDYDAFVRGPRPATQRLLDFCGLEWDEACLAFHNQRNAVKTASVWQVREPLYDRSSGRWRNYAAQVETLREYLSEMP